MSLITKCVLLKINVLIFRNPAHSLLDIVLGCLAIKYWDLYLWMIPFPLFSFCPRNVPIKEIALAQFLKHKLSSQSFGNTSFVYHIVPYRFKATEKQNSTVKLVVKIEAVDGLLLGQTLRRIHTAWLMQTQNLYLFLSLKSSPSSAIFLLLLASSRTTWDTIHEYGIRAEANHW